MLITNYEQENIRVMVPNLESESISELFSKNLATKFIFCLISLAFFTTFLSFFLHILSARDCKYEVYHRYLLQIYSLKFCQFQCL